MEATVEASSRTKPNSTVNMVIEKINQSLAAAAEPLSKENVKLESATVTLMTTNDLSVGGGFSLALKASARWQRQASNSVTYNFVPIKTIDSLSLSSKRLTQAIVDAAKGFGDLLNIPTLKKKNFEVELSVAIIKRGELGVEFKISKTGWDFGVAFERTVYHKINLTFGPTE